MGLCCASARPGHFQSVYAISPDGSSIFEYCITTNQFYQHQLPTQLPAMCKYCEVLPDKLLIAGGFKRLKSRLGESLPSTFIFSKDSGLLSLPPLPQPRTGHCLISQHSIVFLISGVLCQIEPTATCLKFEYFANVWTEIAPISKPRVLAAGCCIGSSLYVTGGNSGNSLQNFRDIERYDVVGDVWENVWIKLPMDVWRHSCLAYGDGFVVFGGSGNRSYNLDCFKVDLKLNVIVQQTWMKQGGEFAGCNVAVGGAVYAFETGRCKVVWVLEQGKWSSRVRREAKVLEYLDQGEI